MTDRDTTLRSASTGILACFVAVSAAHLVASFSRALRNPIFDVGDRVIDVVPSSVKAFAIDVFGTADKPVLLLGIVVLLVAYSAGVGIVSARKGLAVGAIGIGAFGVVGAASALAGPAGATGTAPSLVGAGAGIAALSVLVRGLRSDVDPHLAASRRAFLRVTGAMTFSAFALGGLALRLDRRFDVGSTSFNLPPPVRLLGPLPADVALPTRGLDPFVTPNADFYRIDTALTVPRLDPATYALTISGMVERPLTLTYQELIARPLVESDITLTCVSNEVGGQLVGHARWLGVRLDALLAEAGIDPGADQIVGRSVDGYTCGFPVAALDGRDALVAIAMNGEPLPPEHGFPARLIVPGLYGYVSATKWLTAIELTTFDRFDHYWVGRGWAAQAPVKTQSRIDTPAALGRIAPGPTAVAGVAWAQTRGIDRVEVRIDDGPWRDAGLAAELNDTSWRQWRFSWIATPGRHEISCRATDGTGATQTGDRSRPMPDGATGWHSIVVIAET